MNPGRSTRRASIAFGPAWATSTAHGSMALAFSTPRPASDAIRHFCQGIGDENPLYWDLSHGYNSRYGNIIAPACFLYSVYWCSGRTGGLPGVHGFHAGNDWEWYRPIYLNDNISVQE